MKKYDEMDGRSDRRQFWSFTLVFLILFLICALIGSWAGFYFSIPLQLADGTRTEFNIGILGLVCALIHVIPHWSIACRRLHDVGVSAWWLIFGIFPLIGPLILIGFFAWPGDDAENTYGPAPA